MLDALLAGGLSSLDHVALVAHGDDATRVIVRGAPTATVSSTAGEEVVSATAGTAWAERLVTGVTSIRVDPAPATATAEHALTAGIARVSVVEFGTPSARRRPAAPVAPAGAGRWRPSPCRSRSPSRSPPVMAVEPEPEPSPTPEPEPASPEPVAAAPMSFGEPEDDPTPTGETPGRRCPVPTTGPTATARPWPARPRPTSTARRSPARRSPPRWSRSRWPRWSSRPATSWLVDRTVLVGRAPEARRFASHDQPHVVTVASPHQEISSTHLEIRPGAGADHGSAIATDLGSTNGTVLAQPGLDPEELKAGIAVSLIPGAVLDLGDGVTIQVTNP